MSASRLAHVDAGVLALDDPRARDAAEVGAKAAALARAAAGGLPVLPGFALTPETALSLVAGEDPQASDEVRRAWSALSRGGEASLVVRSSSQHEDTESSSMAGRFDSVLDVRGWDDFVDAVRTVVASGVAAFEAGVIPTACMAVLVQPFVEPTVGGVLFGADPISGRTDRIVVSAAPGTPDALVSGAVDGVTCVLRRSGRTVAADPGADDLVDRSLRRSLARLARGVRRAFGGPQDVEWGLVGGRLTLFQSRPITASSERGAGPVLGPGPVAETFPEPLAALERELWLEPMRTAIAEVLVISGAASRRALARSPIVTSVGGRAAVDLELLGEIRPRGIRAVYRVLDPRGPLRRLGAAWRTGRLRTALPGLARDVIGHVDRRLAAVPDVSTMQAVELLEVMRRTRRALVSVYAYEMLAVQLLGEHSEVTSAAVALRVLVEHRDEGDDAHLVSRYPVLLSLQSPRIGGPRPLPKPSTAPAPRRGGDDDREELREALRLRARWLQELGARAALDLGGRLAAEHRISSPEAVRELDLERLDGLVTGEVALDLGGERPEVGPPLPVRFRLSASGGVVPVDVETGAARGGGGGRAVGTVVHPSDIADAPEDRDLVLVVSTLDPSLAPLLPSVQGLVAETGSPLSHLAILAREAGVATAVGVERAVERFERGATVLVDGTSGEVLCYDPEQDGDPVADAPSGTAPTDEDVRS